MADLVAEIAVSEAKFRQQTRKVFDDALRATTEFEREANAKLSKIGAGFAGSEMTKAQAREYDRLKKQLDPLYAASKRYEGQLEKLNRAQQIGAINSKQYEAALQRINADLAGADEAMDGVGRSAGRFGGNLQNIGFQIGDFATQVGAGTSVTQALGQQLPQLLGGLGAIGAVAGAAAAIMVPLGAALFRAAGESETLEDSMEGLTASTDAMADAANRAATPISELRAEYGDLADEIARASEAQAFFTAQLAKRDLVAAARSAQGEMFGGAGAWTADRAAELSGQSAAEQRGLQIIALSSKLGLAKERTRDLVTELGKLDDVRGPEDMVALTDRLLAILREAPNATTVAAAEIEAITALGQAAADQIAAIQAGGEAIRQRNQQLLESYDQTTQELIQLTEDLDAAEKARAEAASQRNAKEVAQWDRVGEAIRERIKEVRELADGTTEAFEKMADAYQQYGASRLASTASLGDATTLIKEFEGFRSTPYDDGRRDSSGNRVGPAVYRAGFGSDTVTLADGTVQKITQGMRVSLEDANRDLARRIAEFQQGIIGKIGGERWDTFTTEQQAALTSIAYNYGTLPDRIIEAVRSGTGEDIANAISGLAGDNGAINSKRRFREASAFGSGNVARTRFDEGEAQIKKLEAETAAQLRKETAERERQVKLVEDYGRSLAANLVTAEQEVELTRQRAEALQAIEASGLEGSAKAAAIAEVNGEYEKQRLIFALIEDAKRRQVDLDTMMTGSTMTYAQAIAALGDAAKAKVITDQQQAAALEELTTKQEFYNSLQEQMEDGFIDAIVAGESFADVLSNIAQQLAKAALQAALFGKGPFATGGSTGLLGNLFSSIFGGARAMGGPVSAGSAYLVGERGPEIVVPRSAGTVIPNHKLGGGSAEIIVRSEPGVIVEIARREAVTVTRAGVGQYDRAAPARAAQINRDPLRR